MRAAIALACLAACGFEVPGSGGDDAAACTVGAGPPGSATTVGLSTGGGTRRSLACPAGQVIVGAAFEMSDGDANGQPSHSARGIQIACATLVIDSAGAHRGAPTTVDVEGNGGSGWSPSTWTAPAMCLTGAVVSKLAAHGGTRGQDTNLFMDTSIACTQIDAHGAATPGPDIAIAEPTHGTGMNPSSATCPAGSMIVKLDADVGAGLDSVAVTCAPIACR